MNVRGNILIIWQGWKPNLQTSTFWHTISLCLPALPPLYPLVSSSHLTPFVSQGPIKIPPPTSSLTSIPPHSLLSQMSPSFFCSHSQTGAPCRWFNFFGSHHRHLHCPLWSFTCKLTLGWWQISGFWGGGGLLFMCVFASQCACMNVYDNTLLWLIQFLFFLTPFF